MATDTIVAIITPQGLGGVAALRLSGTDSLNIAKKMFDAHGGAELKPRMAVFGKIQAEGFFDEGLVIYFKAPNSFTGEDCVEFFTHGGTHIARGVLEACLKNGARMATNGEFSKRAVLNGKLDVAQAEGIVDMINATSDAAVRAGFGLLQGALSRRVQSMQESLTGCLAEIEVMLDFPEHDIEHKALNDSIVKPLQNVSKELKELEESSREGKIIKHGVILAIAGRPNVGKSSLLNAILGYDRAIVADEQGTTRDVVSESFSYNGIQFNVSDTAGIRSSDSNVERLGIERSFVEIDKADIVLYVVDAITEIADEDKKVLDKITDKPCLVVYNKTDLTKNKTNKAKRIEVSAATGAGIEQLKKTIYNTVLEGKKAFAADEVYITSLRHLQVIRAALSSVNTTIEKLKNNDYEALDVLSIYIRSAWLALGEITGTTSNEAVLDAIFSKFCLGK